MITYSDIEPAQIERIKEIWTKNKEYHIQIEKIFTDQYLELVFEERMEKLFQGQPKLKITIAEENNHPCGYCISKIVKKEGELVSLHVLESHRGKGIGKQLTKMHIEWMREEGSQEIGLFVASGNEQTINFYKQLGLFPNLIYMQLKEEI